MEVLTDPTPGWRAAALEGMGTFVDTLLLMHSAQVSPQVKKGTPAGRGKAAAAKAEAAAAAKAQAEKAASERMPPFRSHTHAKRL
eukprot:scaffold648142_cov45-Prasinocladus_malaysianus.AAC.1